MVHWVNTIKYAPFISGDLETIFMMTRLHYVAWNTWMQLWTINDQQICRFFYLVSLHLAAGQQAFNNFILTRLLRFRDFY